MKNSGLALSILLLSGSILGSAPSQAVESINVQTFNPSTSTRFVFLEDAFKSEFPNPGKIYFGANYNYVNAPFVATDMGQSTKVFDIVSSIQTLDMSFGFKATSGFGIFFGLPIHNITYPDNATPPFMTGTTTALGDMKILAKIRLTSEESNTAFCLIPEFHLPTGSAENFVSDASAYIGGRLALEHAFDNFTLLGNLGYASASNARYTSVTLGQGIDYRQRFNFGIGGFMPINDNWGWSMEYTSMHMVPFDKNLNPNEFYGGFRYAPDDSLAMTLGGSLGKIAGPTGQNFRVVLGLRYTINENEKKK